MTRALLALLLLGCGRVTVVTAGYDYTVPAEAITPAEWGLVGRVFGPTVRPVVWKHFEPILSASWGGRVIDGRNLVIRTPFASPDYTTETDPVKFGMFFHELTHIWQFQGNTYWPCTVYGFTLADTSTFADFCSEQQARIVESYARRFLLNPPGSSVDYLKPDGTLGDTPASDSLLRRIVEREFPGRVR